MLIEQMKAEAAVQTVLQEVKKSRWEIPCVRGMCSSILSFVITQFQIALKMFIFDKELKNIYDFGISFA